MSVCSREYGRLGATVCMWVCMWVCLCDIRVGGCVGAVHLRLGWNFDDE